MNHLHFGISLAKNLDLQIYSLVGNFKKNKCFSSIRAPYAFMKLFTINGVKIKALGKPENDLERGFVKLIHWLNFV